MSNDYVQQVRDLAAQLPPLQAKFTTLQTDYLKDKLKAQADLSIKTANAMQGLQALAVLLNGEFDPNSRPAELRAAVTNLSTTWDAAEKASQHYLDVVNSLDTRLDQELQGTRNALGTAQETLHQLNKQREATKSSLNTLRDKLHAQQHIYDDADKYTWIWPPARLYLEFLKLIIEALTHSVANAESAVHVAEGRARAAEQQVKDETARVNTLLSFSSKQAGMLAQSKQLRDRCASLQGDVEFIQHDVARIKNQRYNAWQIIAKCANRAENAEYALTKAEYGTTVLQVAEVAFQDEALRAQAANIVNDLAEHDDSEESIKNIETDEHPNGLLAHVQGLSKNTMNLMSTVLAVGPLLGHNLHLSGAETAADLSHEDRRKILNLLNLY
ncbi:hypothetical protein FHL15_011398 [Xylaria flabelliformis]|uniref:Uncharacterized protein n=1 Tax=Xylaria flabelliformis TaxID=2512241 RepID=A0A553HIE4_9PEZI|nr:hypothetical protein FHL15_011398 [Xylaria flabelliformis]